MFSSFCRFPPRAPPKLPEREPPRPPPLNERDELCEGRPPKRLGPRGPPLKVLRARGVYERDADGAYEELLLERADVCREAPLARGPRLEVKRLPLERLCE